MFRIVFILSVLTLFFSCKNEVKKEVVSDEKKTSKIVELDWLQGNWTNINDESQSYEKWTQINDSTLSAFSYVMVENDTVFVEVVSLQERFNDVFFTVKVPDQNDAEEVTFKLIPSEEGVFTFENKAHDFPKRITYSNPVKDSIHAWIEGVVEGELKRADFQYRRDSDNL
ncbi:MAG: hypothetical protein ACI8ZM_005746 [Crocinitomix sp.]|jgi:hypothetical protein